MFEALIWATGFVALGSAWYAYRTSGDPLHPLVYFGPMMFYMYAFGPWALNQTDAFERYFPETWQLQFVQAYTLLGVSCFCLACASLKIPKGGVRLVSRPFALSPVLKQRVILLAMILGCVGLALWVYLVILSGGLGTAYGGRKGGLISPSGYFSEGVNLTMPAIILLSMGWQGRRATKRYYSWVALLAMPHLIHAFFAGSRGPTFTIVVTLMLSQYLRILKRPTFRQVVGGIFVLGILVVFMFAHRSQVHVGAEFEFQKGFFIESLIPHEDEVSAGDNYIFSSGLILLAKYHNKYYWGKRYAVILFVRPIPRQIWPTKYEDTGMGWMLDKDLIYGSTFSEWRDAVGWIPLSGSAAGFISDMFIELAWWGLIPCMLLGYLFGYLWQRSVVESGLWSILYIEAAMLSIYIPTQSVSAFLHRFLFMCVPTIMLWKYLIDPILRRRQTHAMPRPPSNGRFSGAGRRSTS